MKRLILILVLLCSSAFAANSVYIASAAAGANDGTSCANAKAYSYFNTAGNWSATPTGIQIGPDTTVHLCGTITETINTTSLTFQGSGTSGHPVTLLFESGAILQSPAFPSSIGGTTAGAIAANGKNYLVIDLGSNGVIENTANGSNLANSVASTLITLLNCNTCEVKSNSRSSGVLRNVYVHVQNTAVAFDSSTALAIDWSGSNNSFHDLNVHDCGWCINSSFGNGDTTNSVYNIDFSAFGHTFAYGATGTQAATSISLHDNLMHDASNWQVANCGGIHVNGGHFFGVAGTSTINGLYVYNNYYYGDWGTCPTGFLFIEGGAAPASAPAGASNCYVWNNVGVLGNSFENTQGWYGIFGCTGGVTDIYNNTLIGFGVTTDNALAYGISGAASLSFVNNVASNIENPICIAGSTITTLDRNLYGGAAVCAHGGNCYTFGGPGTSCGTGTFEGNIGAWRTASGGDTNAAQSASPGLNADGTPQPGYIGLPGGSTPGANLAASATGALATLANATTQGGGINALARPANGAGNWTIGAYNLMYLLTVTTAGGGTGTVTSGDSLINCGATCTAEYNSGGSVTLTETPGGSSTFQGWSGGTCTGSSSTCSITMNSAVTATATFNTNTAPGITFSCVSPVKNGSTSLCSWTVTGSPFSACSIGALDITASCASGTHTFTVNGQTTYTLSATNASGTSTASFTVNMGGVALGSNVKLASGVAFQ